MFKCGQCGRQVGPRVKMRRRVTATRAVVYRDGAGQVTGKGTETVKEVAVCPLCALATA